MTSDRLADVPEHIREAARDARSQYERVYSEYRAFAESVATVLKACLQDEESQILSVAPRAKEPDSFERKAATRSKDDPTQPKYPDPINDITDKAGVRVITYFLSAVRSVARIVEKNFDVIQKLDKGMEHHDQVGYESLHFLVRSRGIPQPCIPGGARGARRRRRTRHSHSEWGRGLTRASRAVQTFVID